MIKIWLDDERVAPIGWIWCKTPKEVIEIFNNNKIDIISLDHDLGEDDVIGTGYDVICYIEEQVINGKIPPQTIVVHSANISARLKMEQGITAIYKFANKLSKI